MKLKSGFTTGSVATAAAKAATWMLLSGKKKENICIITPSKKEYVALVEEAHIELNRASCVIHKEASDDPDITAGAAIEVTVEKCTDGIIITGGKGVGVVTRPGLDQKVGEYAINSTPRRMIEKEVSEVMDTFDYKGGLKVIVSVRDGEEIAKKTFNPHMGIEGGISIIGTTGIVEPMSTKAILDTIKLDISMQYSEGKKVCIICPGNYGVTFLSNKYGVKSEDIVTCSNYAGDSVKYAIDQGFKKILFVSHIGKLIKVSGGIMNTHSQYGDHRMEIMAASYKEACLKSGCDADEKIIKSILEQVSTTAALDILNEIDFVKETSDVIVLNAGMHLNKIAVSGNVECILYENNYGELSRTGDAYTYLQDII